MKLEQIVILNRVLAEAIQELSGEGLDVFSLTAKTESSQESSQERWSVTIDRSGRITTQRQS